MNNPETQITPPPAPTIAQLQQLLGALNIPFQAKSLEAAGQQLISAYVPGRIAEWVRAVLSRSDIKGVLPLQLVWKRFDRQRLPALVWHNDAWHMAEKISEQGQVTLLNASGKSQTCTSDDLANAGVLWLRRAPQHALADGSNSPSARMVLREMFRSKAWLVNVIIATVVVNLLAIATSLYAMQVYDRVVPTLAWTTLVTLSVGMCTAVLMEAALKTWRARIVDGLGCSVDKAVSQRVFEHLLHIQIDKQPRSVGTLAAQVGGLDGIRQFFSSTVIFGLVDMPFALMFLAFVYIIGSSVAYVYALMLPISIGIGWLTHRRLRLLVARQINRSNERQGILVDAIRGAEAVRAANAGWSFAQDWQNMTHTISSYGVQQKAINNSLSVFTAALSSFAYVAAIVVGVWEVAQGQLSTGGMVACSILGGRVIAPIVQMVQYMAQWEHVSQAMRMVDAVLLLDSERRPEQSLLTPTLPEADLSFSLEKIRYAYPESPVMQVQVPGPLHFKAGERVLLLGPVGCGKSTLLKIMAGLYRPSEGRVRVADTDLWEIDPQALARHVAYLPQDVHLFKGTLRSNLTLSTLVSDERVQQVAKALNLDQLAANHPLGMDLPISEGGVGLSGGQRQLVALSRVIMAQPRIWLLDEPTASLDPEREIQVWNAIMQFVGPHDILIVSTHKIGPWLGLAHRVIVMRDGAVVTDDKPQVVFPQFFQQATPARPVTTTVTPHYG